MVTGEKGERLLLPAPVLENLRRQLDEVPGDAGPREGLDLDLAKQVMEQMAELVEDGRDLVVREQGLLPGDRRVKLPHIRPRCGANAPSARGPPVRKKFIQAPPRFDSRGNQSV